MSVRGWALALAGWLAVGAAQAQTQAAAPASRQAIYDTAQAAFDANGWAAAASGFAQLLPIDTSRPLLRSEAVIAARYAETLVHLQRYDEALNWIDRALPVLPPDDTVQRGESWIAKGDAERFRYDYSSALKSYAQADTLVEPLGMTNLLVSARLGEAFAGVTVDPAFVRQKLQALRARPDFRKAVNDQLLAEIEDLEARAAINMGDKAAAWSLIRRAVDDSGGLTQKVNMNQVAIRADAGIIAKLNNDDDNTRRYLAFTGAGHLPDSNWVSRHSGELPVCNDAIQPDDTVVVSLVINDDGRVSGAIPVYASHMGELGVTFAKAINDWRWDPEAIRKVEPFWRSTLQLGLRCVTRPDPESLDAFVRQEVRTWLVQHGLLDATLAAKPGALMIRKDDPRLSKTGGAVLAAVYGPAPETAGATEARWAALEAAQAPAAAYAELIVRWASKQGGKTIARKAYYSFFADTVAKWTPRLRARFPNDRALDWLVLREALARQDSGDFAGAQPLLDTLASTRSDAELNSDPIRSVALLHQAIGLEHAGNAAAARASLDRSGLSENTCSLIDTHPIIKERRVDAEDYPEAAMNMGFEGFTEVGYDIADDGRVKNARTVIAYPPFIFDKSIELAVSRFRYEPPRIGGKAVGCEGHTFSINYRIATD